MVTVHSQGFRRSQRPPSLKSVTPGHANGGISGSSRLEGSFVGGGVSDRVSLTPLQAVNTLPPPNRCSVLVLHYVPHSQCLPPHTTANMPTFLRSGPHAPASQLPASTQPPLLLLVSVTALCEWRQCQDGLAMVHRTTRQSSPERWLRPRV